MPRPAREVADIFRGHGAAWRAANAGHVSLGQLKVMSAIEDCRTAALGGHVVRCENAACGYTAIAYNSCRNRHCPKCQGAAAREWLGEREAELLPVPYFHVVFSLPAQVADIAYQNKAVIYDILFKASAETMITIAAQHRGDLVVAVSNSHTTNDLQRLHGRGRFRYGTWSFHRELRMRTSPPVNHQLKVFFILVSAPDDLFDGGAEDHLLKCRGTVVALPDSSKVIAHRMYSDFLFRR
jgi:hypothetical protein